MGTAPKQNPSPHFDLWQSVPYLAGLPPSTVQALADLAILRQYTAGTLIFSEGEPVAGLFLIEAGAVKISRFSKEGREHILHIRKRGDTFNDVAALDGGPNPATATAFSDVLIWRIARPDLRRVVDAHPALAWALIESLAHRARHLVDAVQDLSMRDVKGRLARLLLEQAQANTAPRLLTQEEIASQLGTVREVVGRALRALTTQGIIKFDRHRIIILDQERLAEAAEA